LRYVMYFRFMDDVTFGRNGPGGKPTTTNRVAIPGQSLMSMNALFYLIFSWRKMTLEDLCKSCRTFCYCIVLYCKWANRFTRPQKPGPIVVLYRPTERYIIPGVSGGTGG